MGIEYEPTEVGLLQNPFQARTISTFRQPKPFWLFIKDIDVLIAGEYPGDGKPKPVAFPDPAVASRTEGVALLPLEKLVELKLASGLSAAHRLKDLADVLELIGAAKLPQDLGTRLDPSVRGKYAELWRAWQSAPKE